MPGTAMLRLIRATGSCDEGFPSSALATRTGWGDRQHPMAAGFMALLEWTMCEAWESDPRDLTRYGIPKGA